MSPRPALALFLFMLLPIAPALALPFPVAPAEQRTASREAVLDGVVEAVNRSTVSAQTSGRVQEILVDVNDEVAQGATIVRLRDAEQRAGLEQAEAALREARARFEEAQTEYNRVRNIYARKLVAKAELDTAAAALAAARARLEGARAAVDQAREQLDNTVVKAPYGGIVLERHVQLGEAVQPGTPLMTGFSLEDLRVVANVPQRLINPVRRHAQARVLLADGTGVAAAGLVFFPYADPASNVFKVRVNLPKGVQGLYPGMFVKTAFTVGEETRLTVPAAAVVRRGEVTAVYVVDGERVALRQIRAGRAEADRVEVLAGLEAGESVALDPVAAGVYLKEGGR